MSRTRRRLWLLLKTAATAVLVAAVGWHFAKLLGKPELWRESVRVRPEYLLPAGLLYLGAHTLWGTFWVQLLRSKGADVPWLTGVRAYFVSQFGKYVPGKAWVILLRVGLLRHLGLSPTVVAVTATYETLTTMAAGAVVGAALLPYTGIGLKMGSGLGVFLVALAGLPVALGLLNRVAVRVARKRRGPDHRPLLSPPIRLLAQGLAQALVGWCLLGLSLWLTVQGVAAEPAELTAGHYLQDLAAAGLSYVVGFAVLFLPGGIGAREFFLQKILARQLAPAPAADELSVVIALVLRLVWTAFEVVAAGGLYWLARPRTAGTVEIEAEPVPVSGRSGSE